MTEARELYLFIINESAVYDRYKMICHSLERKILAGKFEMDKAQNAFTSLVRDCAKLYCQRFGGVYNQVFSVKARKETCAKLAEGFYSDYEEENE